MAKARMLHKTISLSGEVNKLSLPARLLFTWMIPHADDDGRLKGDPEHIKAMVTPMTKWSFKKISDYLTEMHKAGLIIRWLNNKDESFIEFPNWKKYQSIKSDRYKPSDLPSFEEKKGNKEAPNVSRNDSITSPQSNISELNKVEINKSENNGGKPLTDENLIRVINPKTFEPQNEGEVAAKEAWEQLEPNNPYAFQSTYLKALEEGLPTTLFYEYTSQIKQDPSIKNPGAVFNKKVEDYLINQKG